MRNKDVGETFVSFGGAGLIHPKEIRTTAGYSAGAHVRVELTADRRQVLFYVDGTMVGSDAWDPRDDAVPAISIDSNDSGDSELDVRFLTDVTDQQVAVVYSSVMVRGCSAENLRKAPHLVWFNALSHRPGTMRSRRPALG
jgi:hypothetical protein